MNGFSVPYASFLNSRGTFCEWFHGEPLIDMRLFKGENFSNACIMIFFAGAVSFSSTVRMPQYLQTPIGYSAGQPV